MLQKLYIKNLAIIEELLIDFKSGLNIITGETGSGKSRLCEDPGGPGDPWRGRATPGV